MLVKEFVKTSQFFKDVLPEIDLPTQDGQWRSSREIARSASGVALKHRVLEEFRSPLRLNTQDQLAGQAQPNEQIQGNTWDILEKYFEKWKERLPDSNFGAVGAFLSLLGDGTRRRPNGKTETKLI